MPSPLSPTSEKQSVEAGASRRWWRLWLEQPRKTRLRRVLFQVHLWGALAIGLLVSLMGLSGACIVYKDALDVKLNPKLMEASGPAAVDPATMLRTAQKEHPGWNVLLLDTSTQPAWAFYLSRSGWVPASQVDVIFIDPATGRILGHRASNGGFMNRLMDLHINLLSGTRGNQVVGVLACIVFTVSLTGLIIWWPGRTRWRNSLRISFKARWPRLNWDLHNTVGFFASLPLALQAVTALSFVFPVLVVPALAAVLHGSMADIQRFQDNGHSHGASSGVATADLTSMVKASAQLFPGMQLKSVNFPLSPDDTFQVTMGGQHFDDRGSQAKVIFDRNSGDLLSSIDTDRESLAVRVFVALGPWHFGHIAGTLSHLLWMCLGLCPSILFVSGFLMWWRRVLSPFLRDVRAR